MKEDRDKVAYDLIYMWNIKNKTKKDRLIDTETKPDCQRGGGWGIYGIGKTD